MEYDQLTLTQAAAELAAGKITSHALTSEALARAKANADLNAFVTLDEEGALKAAVAFDTQGAGAGHRPLGGVPIVIKDNIAVAGLPCTAGTPGLKSFIPGADANDMILQARTWERHDVGATPGFNGDLERALRSIKVPFLYMPSETDLYFPVGDARYEAQFMSTVSLVPIPSLWGHPAGAGARGIKPRRVRARRAYRLAHSSARANALRDPGCRAGTDQGRPDPRDQGGRRGLDSAEREALAWRRADLGHGPCRDA